MFSTLDMHILEILCEDARITPREIAVMTGSDEGSVNSALESLRRAGVLVPVTPSRTERRLWTKDASSLSVAASHSTIRS